MRPFVAAVLLVGLSVAIAKADGNPTPPPSMVAPEDDSRLAKQTGAQPQKIGVLSYYPNNGGGYTFVEHAHIAFYSLPYMPSTYRVGVSEFQAGQVRHTTAVLGIIGTSTMARGGQTLYRSEMKEIVPGVADRRREDAPIAKWTRATPDGHFHLSIIAEDSETRVKLKSIVPVLERAEHGR
jgi:hypothetical protein